MSIIIDPANGNKRPVILQFTFPGGMVLRPEFIVSVEKNEDFAFEICNDPQEAAPRWTCTMKHPPPEEDAIIELRISGECYSNPYIEIMEGPGIVLAEPITDPPPASWMWGGNTFHLYFFWTSDDGTTVPADNTGVDDGVQPGSPLLVTMLEPNPEDKKVKVKYPKPDDPIQT